MRWQSLFVLVVWILSGCAHSMPATAMPATAAFAPGTTVTVHTRSNERIVGEVSDQTNDTLVVEGRSIRKSEIQSVEAQVDPSSEPLVVESPDANRVRGGSARRVATGAAVAGGVIVGVAVTVGVVLLVVSAIAAVGFLLALFAF